MVRRGRGRGGEREARDEHKDEAERPRDRRYEKGMEDMQLEVEKKLC